MALTEKYWRNHPEAPFSVLLDTVEAYCHPEAHDEAYEDLITRVRSPEGDPAIQRFRSQLRDALRDRSALPEDALYAAAQYSDGSDRAFLERLWRDLYPDEPLPER